MKALVIMGTSLLLLSLVGFFAAPCSGEGKVTIWKKEDSPIYLSTNITVAQGETLIIEPGVKVICRTYDWYINVYGKLEAKGSPGERISFSGRYDITNQWNGIYLYSDDNLLEHCDVSNSVYGIWSQGNGQVFRDCVISRCNVGMYLSGDDNRVEGCTMKDLIFLGASLWGSGNIVTDTVFQNCSDAGVFMRDSERNQITNCTFAKTHPSYTIWNGVRLFHSSQNLISNCTFERLYNGANLENQSNDNRLIDNVFRNCTFGNILYTEEHHHDLEEDPAGEEHVGGSDNNVIAYNQYLGNYNGMVITGKDNLVMGNDIHQSTNYGIYFFNESTNGNRVYLNNLVDNAMDLFDISGTNLYNGIDKEGNYWSKANLTDKNEDGIGDSAYGLDDHPLMDPLVFESGRLEDYDTDRDGLKDYRDPDDDNDGFSDIEERQSGYDPKDKNDHPPKDPYSIEAYLLIIFFALLIIATICLFAFFARKRSK